MQKIINKIIQGDALEVLKTLESESVDCVVTSPPYWGLRDYGVPGQLGLEDDPQDYVQRLCDIFDEVMRVLKPSGTCWVNIGDTYGGTKVGNTEARKNKRLVSAAFKKDGGIEKSLCQIPSRFAIEMTNRGWILRNEIIWHKLNCMPASVKDRFTVDFEKVFFFTKSKRYYFKQQYQELADSTRKDPRSAKGAYTLQRRQRDFPGKAQQGSGMLKPNAQGRNMRTTWSVSTRPYKEAHFATFPEALIEVPIKAGCPIGGIVLDPFMGAGTTGLVAKKQKKNYIGIELNPAYIEIAKKRIRSL